MIDKGTSIEQYNYNLPDERIAKYPLNKRDESKLLIYNSEIRQDIFKNISDYLPGNSLLVSNNTKVIRARLEFFKETGAKIEVFCLEPETPSDYNISFSQTKKCSWQCIIGNLKKWKTGELKKELVINQQSTTLVIERKEKVNNSHIVEFSWDNENFTFSEILENTGNIPIPPYLNRGSEKSDLETYQTIYSKIKGSVAAPTAGLHFTNDVFDNLKRKNIALHEVTLHVGAGTFKPVKDDNFTDHEMHTEQFILTKDTIPALIQNLGNITAVGTTTVRTLESLFWLGVNILTRKGTPEFNFHVNQWEPYKNRPQITVEESLNALQNEILKSETNYIKASTAIMIIPGYIFKIVDRLITNFHQPKSTLLLLVSALIGDNWRSVYEYALKNEFRFLSYGDSCLFVKKKAGSK